MLLLVCLIDRLSVFLKKVFAIYQGILPATTPAIEVSTFYRTTPPPPFSQWVWIRTTEPEGSRQQSSSRSHSPLVPRKLCLRRVNLTMRTLRITAIFCAVEMRLDGENSFVRVRSPLPLRLPSSPQRSIYWNPSVLTSSFIRWVHHSLLVMCTSSIPGLIVILLSTFSG